MRRAAEWLLLPLFLLPVGIALGLHLRLEHAYRVELEGFRREGPAGVRRWLETGGPGHGLLDEFDRGSEPRVRFILSRSRRGVRFELGTRGGFLSLGRRFEPSDDVSPWKQSETYPAGLVPAALTDARTRLAVQTGRMADVADGLDSASREFRALLDSPEIRRLARAPLPAATKLYLVRHWRRQGVTLPMLEGAEHVLAFLVRVEDCLLGREGPYPAGVYEQAGVQVIARPPEEAVFMPASNVSVLAPTTPGWFEATDGTDGPVALRFLGANSLRPDPAVLWQGRIETPLAGQWAFVRRFGPRWWSAPRYRRWIGPTAALLLAFLFIPAALLVSMRRRRRLDEARSRFLNELAHDLRTPLTSLRLYADMLARKSSGDEERDRYAQVMTRESARVSALLGNLLDLSRLEDGRRNLETQDVPLAPVARQAAEDFAQLYPARASDLAMRGSDALTARADATALARCLANLLDNTGKYTDAGTAVRLTWRAVGLEIRIRVEDDGPGIPADERGAAFTRYARGARAKRDGLPGTGLGLALVKELATEMGGSVRLEPSSAGTAIELRVPRAGSPEPEEAA